MRRPDASQCLPLLLLLSLLPAFTGADEPEAPRIGVFPGGGATWIVETRQPRDYLESIAWSPDGRLLACAEARGPVKIYAADTWQLVNVLGAETGVTSLAWSPNGKYLAGTINGQAIRIWEADGIPVTRMTAPFGIHHLAWSPDSEHLLTTLYYRRWCIWDRDGRMLLQPSAELAAGISSVAWSGNGKEVVTGGRDGSVRIWQITEARSAREEAIPVPDSPIPSDAPFPVFGGEECIVPFRSLRGGASGILALRWQSDGDLLAVRHQDGTVRLWTAEGKLYHELKVDKDGEDIAWSPNGKLLAISSPLRIWNVAEKKLSLLAGPDARARRLAWSSDNKLLAGTEEASVTTWDMKGEAKKVIAGTKVSEVYARPAMWHTDKELVGAIDRNQVARFWKLGDPREVTVWKVPKNAFALSSASADWVVTQTFADRALRFWKYDGTPGPVVENVPGPTKLAWSPNGKRLAIGCTQGFLWLADAEGKIVAKLDEEHGRRIDYLHWSPNSEWLASASLVADNRIRLWRASGEGGPVLDGRGTQIRGIAWHPDSKQLASIELKGAVRMWNVDGSVGLPVRGHEGQGNAVAWSPDGEWLASSSTEVRFWRPDGTPGAIMKSQGNSHVIQLTWSPDGAYLACQQRDAILLCSIRGEVKRLLSAQRLAMESAHWSADGKLIACPTDDNSLVVWNADSGRVHFVGLALADGSTATLNDRGELLGGDPASFNRQFVRLTRMPGGNLELIPTADEQAKP